MRFSLFARRLQRWRWGIPLTCALTAVAVAIPTLALAGHGSSSVTDYTGCMNTGGALSNFAVGTAPKSPCSSSQTEVHISGGDITLVATPSSGGLQGGTTNGAASVELQQSYKLPQTCAGGEVPKWNGSAWACAAVTTSDQSCPSGKFAIGIDASGALICDTPAAPSLSVVSVNDQVQVPFAGPAVADARCPAGYKLVGGGWGTRNAVADGADVFDYTGGNPPGGGEGTGGPDAYDVGAASANPIGGGTVYARAYCIKLN